MIYFSMEQAEFENKLIAFITDSDHKGLMLLKEQLEHAEVDTREMTEVQGRTDPSSGTVEDKRIRGAGNPRVGRLV